MVLNADSAGASHTTPRFLLEAREWWLALGLLALDQVTKAIARATDPANALFELVHNTGAGFGILHGRNDLLMAISILALALVARPLVRSTGRERLALLCFTTGIVGNLIDRVTQHGVTDFIAIFSVVNFPVFNVADILISLSVAYLAADLILRTYHSWQFKRKTRRTGREDKRR